MYKRKEITELHQIMRRVFVMIDKVKAEISLLIELNRIDEAYVSRPLLTFIKLWDEMLPDEQTFRLTELSDALKDGLDIDFTGTQWEAEWLANGKVCRCKACVTARNALEAIRIAKTQSV
jgi:hypothetical protein